MDSLRIVEKCVGKKADIIYREMHHADVTRPGPTSPRPAKGLAWRAGLA
jgi:hypothetical protein